MSSTNKPPKIVLLNGPPRVGKDTAGAYLASKYGSVVKFAEPIKAAATAIYHRGDRAAFDRIDTAAYKDLPQEIYFGKTCREVQIGVSEKFLKDFHGDPAIFGQFLRREIEYRESVPELFPRHTYFATDSGFDKEALVLVNEYGPANVMLLRLHRKGHDYRGDSRGYITLSAFGVREHDVDNEELDKYLSEVDALTQSFLSE